MNYKEYTSIYPGGVKVLGGSLYDTQWCVAATTLQLTYFAALGPLNVTNMELAGVLPAPKAFLVRAIRVDVLQHPWTQAQVATTVIQPGAMYNMCLMIDTGVLELWIGSKIFAQYPIWLLPGGCGTHPHQAVDGDSAAAPVVCDMATNGDPHTWNVHILTKPIFIEPQVNFRATITWPVVLAAMVGTAVPIRVILDGDQIRPIQ
jgi:hypothetical protein